MVGPGTGIAPFIAFLQERKASGARGMNWLFCGGQHADSDYLYRAELLQCLEQRLLTRLDTAFSRDQEKKIYVQDRMLEKSTEIWNWITSGACIYVCGDARRMARDVEQALMQIIAREGRMSSEDAKAFVGKLSQNRRYMKDVY
jgi:sulfite reductase (NADPH) flavoprotein alpha-component